MDDIVLTKQVGAAKSGQTQTLIRGKFLPTRKSHLVKYHTTGVYYLYWKHKSKRWERSLETTIESVAEKRRDELKKAIAEQCANQKSANLKGAISFNDLLDFFLEETKKRNDLKLITIKLYDSNIRGIKKHWPKTLGSIETLDARKINSVTLKTFFDPLVKTKSGSFVNKISRLLKDVFELAIKEGIRGDNPAKDLEHVAEARGEKAKDTPSEAQYAALLSWISNSSIPNKIKLAIIDTIEFLSLTGLRIGEASQLLKTDIDLAKNIIKVRATTTKGRKGKEKGRWVDILPDARPLIERLLNRETPPACFGNVREDKYLLPISTCDKTLATACKALAEKGIIAEGVNYGHHTFRHFFATRLIEKGYPINVVAHLLGHTDGGKLALEVYAHVRTQHTQALAQQTRFSTFNASTRNMELPAPKALPDVPSLSVLHEEPLATTSSLN